MQTLCVGFLVSQRPISHWFQRPLQSPPGIYLHLLIPSKAQRSKITFLTSSSKSEKRTPFFSEPHSKISTARPANFFPSKPLQQPREEHAPCEHHEPRAGVRSLVCARESRKGHPQGDTICSRALQDLLCEAWFSGPTRWMLKKHQTCRPDLLAARICASSSPCTGFSRQLPACFCSLLLLLHLYTQILL